MTIPIYKLTQLESVVDDTLIKATSFVTGYTFGGTINASSEPLTEDVNVFYYVANSGTYTNFNNIVISEPGFLYYNVNTGYSHQPFSFSGSGIAGVTSINSITGVVNITTDDIPEGSNNKYFTGTIPTDLSELSDTTNIIASKADVTNVLTLDNTTIYTPTSNYNPATKAFVEELISNITITNTSTANLAYDVDWGTATLPPIPSDALLLSHVADDTIHFTKDSIDTYTQSELDNITNLLDNRIAIIEDWFNSPASIEGVTQALFFSHIYNLSVHFTKEEMFDYVINNIGDINSAAITDAVGDRLYTENNYIVDSETITNSLDSVDINIHTHITNNDIHTDINDINVICGGGVRL